jgi:hypothetical protein
MKTKLLLPCCLLALNLFILNVKGQTLLTPADAFSHSKTAYITKTDGTELKGTIDDIDRKKGLIEEITILDESKKKIKLKPEEVKYMYLPQSGLDKLDKALDVATDAQKWGDEKIKSDLIKDGYTYFEQSEVMIKKNKMVLLMQLLNPTFCKFVRIYQDPLAQESASFGVAGIKLAGGDEKSYYFKKGEEPAYRLYRSDYKENFKTIWSDCPNLISKYESHLKWTDLAKQVCDYSTDCK